jgi:hypothetical protein
MPQEPQCQSPAWNHEFETGDPWLSVHNQQLPKPPVPPEVILPWIDQQALKQATDDMPKLRPTRLEPDREVEIGEGEEPPLVERRLDDHPEADPTSPRGVRIMAIMERPLLAQSGRWSERPRRLSAQKQSFRQRGKRQSHAKRRAASRLVLCR